MWPPELAVLLTVLFSTFRFTDLRRKHSSSPACLSGSCEPHALCPSMPSSCLCNNVGGDHELPGRQCCVVILMGKTKQKLVIVRAISVAGLVVGLVLLVSNMCFSTQPGSWLPTVRCSLADKLPPTTPPSCTLPSGLQFTECNHVEKMWSLFALSTD